MGGKVQTIIDGEEAVRVKAAGDKQIGGGVGDPDAVVQPPQGKGVDDPIGIFGQGASQIVQAVVGVNGGHCRQSGGAAEKSPHHIAPGAVAVDEIIAAVQNKLLQLPESAENIITGKDDRGDAQLSCLLGKGAVHETDHSHVDVTGQIP